jgi:hypothetical protein
MMRMSCAKAGMLAARRTAGLADADRLFLEEHLGQCDRCATDARLLAAVVKLAGSGDALLSPRARSRAIDRALGSTTEPQPVPEQRVVGAWWRRVALAAALAAVLAVAVGTTLGRGAARVAPGLCDPERGLVRTLLGPGRLLNGDLLADGEPVAVGASWRAGASLTTEAGATIALGHATVGLGAHSAFGWDASRATVVLGLGQVEVDVDPDAGRRFAVAGAGFEARVVGTHFEVTTAAVRVTRGHVRVVQLPDGQALAELGPGESWSAPAPVESLAVTEPSAPTPESLGSSARPRAEAPDIALAEARRLLAEGKAPAARRVLGGVLAGPLSPALEAEARSLLAECALVGGDDAEAAKRYAEVARRFPGSPAGETALFAAARTEQDAGHPGAARALLRQYLERYPDGRFAVEARARLGALPRKGQ